MGYSFDFFVGRMECPSCGTVSAADDSTNMQTYVRDDPQLAFLGEGAPLEAEAGNLLESGYLLIRAPSPGEAVRILQSWECPSCGAPYHWGEIVVRDGIIERVAAVAMNRAVFERSHFIAAECDSLAADLLGKPVQEVVGQDLVGILRAQLPPLPA